MMPGMNSVALHRGTWGALSVDYVLSPSLAKTFSFCAFIRAFVFMAILSAVVLCPGSF